MSVAAALGLFAACTKTQGPNGALGAGPQPPAALKAEGPELQTQKTSWGMPVSVHPALPSEPLFSLHLLLPAGSASEAPGATGAAMVAAELLGRAGVESMDGVRGSGAAMDADGVGLLAATWAVDLHVTAGLDYLWLEASGASAFAADAVQLLCGVAFRPWVDSAAWGGALDAVMSAADERMMGSAALVDEVLLARIASGALARPALPSIEELETLEPAAVAQLLERAASPQHAYLLVGTSLPLETIAVAAEQCRPSLRFPPLPPPEPAPLPQVPKAPRLWVVTPDSPSAYVRVGGPAPARNTVASATLQVALNGLANGFSSRLVTDLRTNRGLVYGVDAVVGGNRHQGYWSVGTSTRPAHVQEVAQSLEAAVDGLFKQGMDAPTWQRLSRSAALGFFQGTEDLQERSRRIADGWTLGLAPGWSWTLPTQWWTMSSEKAWAHVASSLAPQTHVLVVAAPRAPWMEDPRAGFAILDAEDWPPLVEQAPQGPQQSLPGN